MDIRDKNRATHIPIEKEYIKGVNLIDIDTTIADYMRNVIIPDLSENGNVVKVPLIYGNAERWEGARKNGYLRDQRGQIQIPMVMFKRNSVERDSTMQHFKEGLYMPTYKKYSSKNKYEKFKIQNNVIPPVYELYNVRIPSYVVVSYEVMIWTSFTEHMNIILEAFQYATDRYWGREDGYRFRSRIDSFDTQQEVAEGNERLIRTTFTVSVNAYLLAETYNEIPTVHKNFSKKKVVFGIETTLDKDISLKSDYYTVIDYIGLTESKIAEYVNSTTVKLTNVTMPILPNELVYNFDTANTFKVYRNGNYIKPNFYTFTYNATNSEIEFVFIGLGEDILLTDEILISGKFNIT
jgi:hypothetical protein